MLADGATGTCVFAWDELAFRARLDAAGLAFHPGRKVIPETLLRPRPPDGVHLRACSEGFEGQVWDAGLPIAGRWWPHPPDAQAWLNFQRGAGLAPERQSPTAPPPQPVGSWLERPWLMPQTPEGLSARTKLREHLFMGALTMLLLVPTVHFALQAWSAHDTLQALQSERDQLERSTQPLLLARTEAQQTLSQLELVDSLVVRADPLQLLAHIAGRLPRDGNVLRELDWEGERLRLALSVPASTARITYVRALEGGGWLRELREEPQDTGSSGNLVLAGTVAGTAPGTNEAARPTRPTATGGGTRP